MSNNALLHAKDPDSVWRNLNLDEDGQLKVSVEAFDAGAVSPIPGIGIPEYDYISLTYTGSDLTSVVYKTGGSGGTTVATLTLTYSDGKVATVTRS